eukprot:scaffold2639_cov361-Pavlova_lutheri.AAC.51
MGMMRGRDESVEAMNGNHEGEKRVREASTSRHHVAPARHAGSAMGVKPMYHQWDMIAGKCTWTDEDAIRSTIHAPGGRSE